MWEEMEASLRRAQAPFGDAVELLRCAGAKLARAREEGTREEDVLFALALKKRAEEELRVAVEEMGRAGRIIGEQGQAALGRRFP